MLSLYSLFTVCFIYVWLPGIIVVTGNFRMLSCLPSVHPQVLSLSSYFLRAENENGRDVAPGVYRLRSARLR